MDQSKSLSRTSSLLKAAGSSILLLLFLYLLVAIIGFVYHTIGNFFYPGFDFQNSFFITGIITIHSFFIAIFAGYILNKMNFHDVFPLKKVSFEFLFYLAILSSGLVILLSDADNFIRDHVPIHDFFSDMLADLLNGKTFIETAFLVGFVAPLTEELLFRGVIYRMLRNVSSMHISVLISAALFSIFHVNPLQMTGAFVAGIVLAFILEKTGNILYPLFIHAFFNLFPLVILRLTNLQIPGFTDLNKDTVTYQPLWFNLTGLALLVLGIYLSHRFIKHSFKIQNLPDLKSESPAEN